MEMTIKIDIKGQHYQGGACLNIPELMTRSFSPMKTTDIPELSLHGDEISDDCVEYKSTIKCREDAAQILAKEIADYLVKDMSKLDTHNGYRTNE